MTYFDLLKDPRWQKKRLEVLERENWTCEECGDTSTTLHVHHTYYEKGCKPWEYPSLSLRCLCEPCHARVTAVVAEITRGVGALSLGAQRRVLGFVRFWLTCQPGAGEVAIPVEDEFVAAGIASGLSPLVRGALHHEHILSARDDDGVVRRNPVCTALAVLNLAHDAAVLSRG